MGPCGLGAQYLPYILRSSHTGTSSHYVVVTFEGIANAVVLGKRVKRAEAHGHPHYSALLFCKWQKMLSMATEEDEDRDGEDGILGPIENNWGKKKNILDLEGVS